MPQGVAGRGFAAVAASQSPIYSYIPPVYTGGTVDYSNTKDPVKVAQNQRAMVQSRGDQFISTDQQLANMYDQEQADTQGYLNPIEQKLAGGGGGYAPDEVSQIELSPADRQNIINATGIAAGAGNAAAVAAAQRAFGASGGNPAALAAFRARAAQQQAINAGQAETGAKVAAQQAGSAGAQAVGNARIAQQNQGLQYFGGLQSEQGQQAQNEQGLGQGAYGTQVGGTSAATGEQIKASQLPTTTDKIIGGITGVLGALADGRKAEDGQEAVVGEDGNELIVSPANTTGQLVSAATGVREPYPYLADGDPGSGEAPEYEEYSTPTFGAPQVGDDKAAGFGSKLMDYFRGVQRQQTQPAAGGAAQPWNPTTPYQQIGSMVGTGVRLLSHFLADGRPVEHMASGRVPRLPHMPNYRPRVPLPPRGGYTPLLYKAKPMLAEGRRSMPPVVESAGEPRATLVTQPTRVRLNPQDEVIPLTFRPKAKVRPSAALPAVRAFHAR